ncbi:hypothetical protein AZE42_11574 [Rhizopogon vesiculosus]|uniref:K Homology domain-containing protein n=1 Tax=Rhizopogon vesiculosus TaxID=180088 RepID=A0A1J8QKL7_9AGAM|nr:hypothetical protein AZE42_11574 [Rhizopogon vesiculosus]
MSAESPARSASASPGSRFSSPINAHDTLALRALVNTKEAAVIIGKGGKNAAYLLKRTGVRAGVSKVTPDVHKRVLTVGGSVEAIPGRSSEITSSSSSIQDPRVVPHSCPTMSVESPARNASISPSGSRSSSPINAHDTLTLRALVNTEEADVIIGKGEENADLYEQTGVGVGVSEVTPGVHERVLTVDGSVEAIAKAYNLIISQLVSSRSSPDVAASSRGGRGFPNRRKVQEMERELAPQPSPHTSIRLLISHQLMGAIIGRNGTKIKAIQNASGAGMIASKEMLPQSTERIVEVQGRKIKAIQHASGARMVPSNKALPQSTERIVEVQGTLASIGRAIKEIGKCLLEDLERGQDTVLFHPGVGGDATSGCRRSANGYSAATQSKTPRSPPPLPHSPTVAQSAVKLRTQNISIPSDMSKTRRSPPNPTFSPRKSKTRRSHPNPTFSPRKSKTRRSPPPLPHSPTVAQPAADLRTQNISIPSDMVGCIIGRGGSNITEIRRLSESKISIAKAPHDETGERMFTIIGTPEANEKALFLLHNQLEREQERRGEQQQQQELQE